MNIVAIDIGGTKTLLTYIQGGSVVAREVWPSDFETWQALTDKVALFCKDRSFDGIAIASAGMVSSETITPLNTSVLSFVSQIDVRKEVERQFGKPCLLINDAAAAAYAEFSEALEHQEVRPAGNLLFVTVSTGIGCGLVLSGQPMTSPKGLACHAGHMRGLPARFTPMEACSCGLEDCVENLASGAALGRLASHLTGEPLSAKELFDSRFDRELSRQLIQQSTTQVAHLVDTLHLSLDLDCVVIGGSVGIRDRYFEQLCIDISSLRRPVSPPVMKRARFQADSGAMGAAIRLTETLKHG
ncbi:ROK family protein [Saccharospirillum sp.]|uniref:ROK family protein n=1 Tax=Saccharospirillum sp. TaxID=2033801 RepID=UPI0034A03A31